MMEDQGFAYFQKKAQQITGIDLRSYKAPQMRRRLGTLMVRAKVKNFVEYYRAMEQDPKLLQEFKDFVTINVSEFFRDKTKFEQLRTFVLPSLLNGNAPIKIWSAGCSNGSEPYSVAMILEELGARMYSILATDIDQGILERAQAGQGYRTDDLRNLSPHLLSKHFTRNDDGYDLAPNIKKRVKFKRHDLLREEFEKPFDLIICRNVVIYFTDEAKEEVYRKFHQSLGANGVLFVGGTEVIMKAKELGYQSKYSSFYMKMGGGTK